MLVAEGLAEGEELGSNGLLICNAPVWLGEGGWATTVESGSGQSIEYSLRGERDEAPEP